MSYSSINTISMDELNFFEPLPTSAISLSPENITQAVKISSQILNESQQWETYLNALAFFAFEKWLQERAESLLVNSKVNREDCTLFQPSLGNLINPVNNLRVGSFKVSLITTGSLKEEQFYLPRAIVDLPEFVPHFYVLVEVLEEEEIAWVSSFISYKQLNQEINNNNLQPDSDWNYSISLSWFNNNLDNLLLYLKCLEPTAIPLPVVTNNRASTLLTIKNELEELLPQLRYPETEISQILSWEQATVVLTSPELVNWIYKLQSNSEVETQRKSLSDLLKLITQPALNVGRWLWDELDELAQEFSWQLLPNLTPASAMRSPVEEYQAITAQLDDNGLEIPIQARAAYQDLTLAGIPLRLYAVTWHLLSESEQNEWSLLLILGTPSLVSLPCNIKLRVSDQTGILSEKGLELGTENSYIFTRVVGLWEEKFLVSVSLIDGVEINLPPFAFNLER